MDVTTEAKARYLELDGLTTSPSLAQRLPAELAFQYHALPIAEWEGCLTVAMAHPEDGSARSAVCQALGSTPYLVKGDAGAIDRLLAEIWPGQTPQPPRLLVLDRPSEGPDDGELWAYASALGERLGAALERAVLGEPLPGSDLVVMNEVGRPALLQRLARPSALQIADQCSASLLVARKPVWPLSRLLLVVCCNETGDAALDWCLSLARPGGLAVTLLVITPFLPVVYYDDYVRALLSPGTEVGGWLRWAGQQFERWQIPSAVKIRRGEPEWQVKEELAGGGYGLVVAACEQALRPRPWEKVAGALLGWADCPVLIARRRIRL
jgi:hypothetical protein